jgi:Pyruvate/2-oxoacid:ferredoxin oxidoreductase delta subunit
VARSAEGRRFSYYGNKAKESLKLYNLYSKGCNICVNVNEYGDVNYKIEVKKI